MARSGYIFDSFPDSRAIYFNSLQESVQGNSQAKAREDLVLTQAQGRIYNVLRFIQDVLINVY